MAEQETIIKYKESCISLSLKLLNALYGEDAKYYAGEAYWIGNEIGGVFTWDGYFVNPLNMIDYFELSYTPEEFFDWYEKWMEEEPSPNMKNYKRLIKLTK